MVENNVGNRKIRVLFAKGSWKVLGPAVSFELFASRAYVASYHAFDIYPPPVFLWRRRSFTSRRLHVSVQTFFCFFHQFD